jgi:serine/threonine protein kinase
MFDILPSSFILTPTFDEHAATPFATGGFSDVYEATLGGRRVAVKVLKVSTETIKSVRRVSDLFPHPSKRSLTPADKLLAKEVVGWKWLRHENILPFVGVSLKSPVLSIISERMENGNIMNFIKVHPNHNRLCLVSVRRAPILLSD